MSVFNLSLYERLYSDDLSDVLPEKPKTEPGSKLHKTYKSKIVDGSLELVEDGVINIYEMIQSHKDSCDVNLIIARFANGDSAALNKYKGFFGDVTEFPKTYAEMFERMSNAEVIFDRLPADIRAKYDNDVIKFVSDFGSPDFLSIFADKKPDVVEESSVKVGDDVE